MRADGSAVRGPAAIAAGATTLLGLVAVAGHLTSTSALVRGGADSSPVAPNTGLALALLGAAALAAAAGRHRLGSLLAAPAAIVAALTLVEWATHRSLGIDELVVDAAFGVAGGPPGRMAPNTALALLVIGVPLVLRPVLGAHRVPTVAAGASLAIGIGAIAATGHLLEVPDAYRWSGIVGMALPTTVGVTLLGVSLLLTALAATTGAPRPWLAPIAGWQAPWRRCCCGGSAWRAPATPWFPSPWGSWRRRPASASP